MRHTLIAEMKREIERCLKAFLEEKGMEMHVAANDNASPDNPLVELEAIKDMPLNGSKLLFEIRVVMALLGKRWQCDELVKGIYYCLHPHNVTVGELTVLLMSLHLESLPSSVKGMEKMRAVMRYIVEEC